MIIKKAATLLLALGLSSTLAWGQGESNLEMNPAPAPKTNVNDAELGQFAQAFGELQAMSQKAQAEMMGILAEHEMSPQEYGQMRQQTMTEDSENALAAEDQAKFTKVSEALEAKQMEIQESMSAKIEESGMSMERYQEIAQQLQADPNLQQRLQAKMAKE